MSAAAKGGDGVAKRSLAGLREEPAPELTLKDEQELSRWTGAGRTLQDTPAPEGLETGVVSNVLHGILQKPGEVQKNISFCFIDHAKAFD